MAATTWAVLAFALTLVFAVIWWGSIQRVAIGRSLPLLRGLAGAALLCALVALVQSPGLVGGTLAVLSLVVSGAFLLLGGFARQSDQPASVAVGQPLPSFEALDHEGNPFRSEALRGRPVLIKFFRGHW